MNRREFIGAFGGVAAWPLAARAQRPDRLRHIAILTGLAEDNPETKVRLTAFRQGLEKLGWSEGRNLRIDIRYAPAGAQAQALAQELVALRPEVIFANSTPMATALQRETNSIPIVFVGVSDPVGSGFIKSLARPGGNLTGLLLYEEGIAGKWLAMLKEIAPGLARAALLANQKTTPYAYFLRAAEASASSLGLEVVPGHFENDADIESAIESFARVPNGGLVVPPDLTSVLHRDRIVASAARHRLPAVYALRVFVAAGGLMSYGTDRLDEFRRAASYVDRILRGAAAADLPVQARPSLRPSSTSRPPRPSASTCRRCCSPAPTR
jgi:putative tryptophan/tyrosine transport system substrate-binding protein